MTPNQQQHDDDVPMANMQDDDQSHSSNNQSSCRFSNNNDDEHNNNGDDNDDDRDPYKEWAASKTKALHRSRFVAAFLLFAVTVAAGTLTYFWTYAEAVDDFETKFNDISHQILHVAERNLQNRAGHLQTMTSTIMAYAMQKQKLDADSPLFHYTHKGFAELGHATIGLTGADVVSWSPLIVGGKAERDAWKEYSQANYYDWVEDGVRYYDMALDMQIPLPFPDVFYLNGQQQKTAYPDDAVGTYAASWQMAPLARPQDAVNIDSLSIPAVKQSFEYIKTTVSNTNDDDAINNKNHQVVSKIVHASEVYGGEYAEPYSILVTPLFDSFQTPRSIMGITTAAFSWTALLSDLLQEDFESPLHVIIQWTSCDDDTSSSATYKIQGNVAKFLGLGDLHESDMDSYRQQSIFATDYTDTCNVITLQVYPTDELRQETMKDKPYIWTATIAAVLAMIFIMFFLYDRTVQKRQTQIIHSTAESNAIISTLIPHGIQDRLLPSEESRHKRKMDSGGRSIKSKQQSSSNYPESSKHRLKSYLNETNGAKMVETAATKAKLLEKSEFTMFSDHANNTLANDMDNIDVFETKPIADLFPHATVLFADIAGFTAWSSIREPSQVFTLLETVYHAFDTIAKRRQIFKVETVGDCYVAVTGLPEPRDDHAQMMVKFASECRIKFNELTKQLELTLGPDTGELGIRIGCHSGPVTAGVLRGSKSRFQLFGDTVNTAAAIETTGKRNRVHMSNDTAKLLIAAGKESWVQKRDDLVTAKGKGQIQSYWLAEKEEPSIAGQAGKLGNPMLGIKKTPAANSNKASDLHRIEESLPPNIRRLVEWNVEILKKMLKQIIAKRQQSVQEPGNPESMRKLELSINRNRIVLDEVVETISLPKFETNRRPTAPVNLRDIKLPQEVVDQLRLYVFTIAAMHKTNSFHNFEHASHVTMSVSKLLSRIVAPDIASTGTGGEEDLDQCLHDHTYGITSDPLTQFAVILSALVHDADHSGVSNMQLIQEDHKVARLFKNKSMAEQHSIVLAWEKLMCSPFGDLRNCIYTQPSELFRFRQIMVNTVLATDIFDKELQTLRRNRWDAAFRQWVREHTSVQEDTNRKATIVIEHLIQASDVSHTMQHWHVYQKWNERLFCEMISAYRSGRMAKNPADSWYIGELGFFDNYIIPLAKKLKECGVFGVSSDEYLNYALENRREWEQKGEEIVASMIVKYKVNDGPSTRSERGSIDT